MSRIFLIIILLTFATPVVANDESTAYQAGKIITVSGETISPGVVLVRSGKIIEIGREVAIPKGAQVVDLSEYTLFPGLVHAGDSRGIAGSSNEESSEITPAFRVSHAINPDSVVWKRLKKLGVTTVHIEPGDRNVIGGLGSV
ncbi:MAG: hypothetical protein QF645_10130, partial [Planctomycetota bacterium]|nr:hypothetical protein [Planctomycetota bacterium]